MGTLSLNALKPFPFPAKPLDADKAPTQIRGQDNQIAAAFTAHDADGTLHTVTTTTSSVTTSAKAILTVVTGLARVVVSGYRAAYAASFVDVVAMNGTTNLAVTVSSTTVDGAPDARAYSVVAGVLKLTMAANTYTVVVCPILLT